MVYCSRSTMLPKNFNKYINYMMERRLVAWQFLLVFVLLEVKINLLEYGKWTLLNMFSRLEMTELSQV